MEVFMSDKQFMLDSMHGVGSPGRIGVGLEGSITPRSTEPSLARHAVAGASFGLDEWQRAGDRFYGDVYAGVESKEQRRGRGAALAGVLVEPRPRPWVGVRGSLALVK